MARRAWARAARRRRASCATTRPSARTSRRRSGRACRAWRFPSKGSPRPSSFASARARDSGAACRGLHTSRSLHGGHGGRRSTTRTRCSRRRDGSWRRGRARPRGARALRDELRRLGIGTADAEAALAAREALATGEDADNPRGVRGAGERASSDASDEAAAARLLVRKGAGLLREPDPRKRRARAYALLARAGFDPATAGRAAATWLMTVGTMLPDEESGADRSGPVSY